ncbi:MAG: XdhC family protein [Clostridia bacterium]|nr:XdhC family protein [Clostridia bacterium]
MKKLFSDIQSHLNAGERVALCSVLASHGSTPRGQGARMAVFLDGTAMGTVGGGAIEHRATLLSHELIKSGNSLVKGFSLNKADIADLGMVCGGDVLISIQVFDSPAQVEAVLSALDSNSDSYLVTEVADERVISYTVTTEPPAPVNGRLYVEKLTSAGKVFLYGGGHVSRALVSVLASVDFRVIVIEDREEFTKPELFPSADGVKKADFSALPEELLPQKSDYAVIMTRGHQSDFEILSQVLKTPATYIGCIGSRHKVAHTRQKLLELGFNEEDFARIHSPIGLPIKAETPAEIAISIAAEMILHRANNK